MSKSYVECDAKKWKCEDLNTRLTNGEKLLKVDYSCTDNWMSIYIRENIYRRLIEGIYTAVSRGVATLVILDENRNVVEPISPDFIY